MSLATDKPGCPDNKIERPRSTAKKFGTRLESCGGSPQLQPVQTSSKWWRKGKVVVVGRSGERDLGSFRGVTQRDAYAWVTRLARGDPGDPSYALPRAFRVKRK